METVSEQRGSVVFGRFRVLPLHRDLLADGQPVRIGGRAFDLLMVLIEARGAMVSKDALMARLWPDRVVEENALQVQISALRTAFGPDRELIRTVSGRGYQFTGEIIIQANGSNEQAGQNNEQASLPTVAVAPAATTPPTNLPEPISELIGRDAELREAVSLAASHRLVTLTGPGGIGKTRLALAAAHELLPQFSHGVRLAEFSPVSDPALVPATVAAAAGLELAAGEISSRRIAQALGSWSVLLVFDTCEHVIDAAAELAEAMLRAGAEIRIIATSREPLRVEGEQIFAVPPLAVPADGDDPTRSGAVQLFAARSRGSGNQWSEDRAVGLAMAAICRRLDGIPLAIEMAAARASTLGIVDLAAHLEDNFKVLTGGRRTALPRHRTLQATLDWSFQLLPDTERVILRRVAVFAGAFSLQAAVAVAAGHEIEPPDVIDGLVALVTKSLVAMAAEGTLARYRLLDTTRAYALEKLVESGEANAIRRRNAEGYRDLLKAATRAATIDDWPAAHRGEIDNIRGALAWAFGAGGDRSIGVALAAASVPIWFEMSLVTECHGWMEQALGAINAVYATPNVEMVLQCALGYSLMFAQGRNDRARTALIRASELAKRLADLDYQLRTLAGLAAMRQRSHDFHGAVTLGRQAEEAVKASSDPIALSIVNYILGSSLHFLGEYADALTYAQGNHIRFATPAVRRAHIARLGRDSFISAGATVAAIQWAQGLPDRSAQVARIILAEAEAGNHPFSLCLALAWCGCVVPLRLGDLQTAHRSIAQLKDVAHSHGLSNDHAHGLCFEGQLAAKRDDVVTAERLLRAGLNDMQQAPNETFYTIFLTALAEVLMVSERLDESLAAADEALQRTERANALWWMPEALRIKGGAVLVSTGDANAAEDHFHRSLDLAHRQGALSWELRAAMSLARSWRAADRIAEARDLLTSVYDCFTEGFGTADLVSAKVLIDELNV